MPRITVVGTYNDGTGQFSVTVDANDTNEAAEAVRRALSPREIEVAGFFEYAPEASDDPPDDVLEAEDVGWEPS